MVEHDNHYCSLSPNHVVGSISFFKSIIIIFNKVIQNFGKTLISFMCMLLYVPLVFLST